MTFTLNTNKATMPALERQKRGLYLGWGGIGLLQFHSASTYPQTHSLKEAERPGQSHVHPLHMPAFPLWGVGGMEIHPKGNFIR